MSHRFEIEEIVTQDSVGVLFRAMDRETGGPVGLRRFFPFGADGGGLMDEERAAYGQAVAHLAGLQLPGLRSVLTGGCDPVDGMPFVATEWIDGPSLAEQLEYGHFTPTAAVAVLDRALEICEALSATLAEEAVWVETAPAMIVLDQGAEQRGYTFGICPIRWLVGSGKRRSLMPLAALAEDLLGWRGRRVGEQAGNGLGGWVRWLRTDPETITLTEARQALGDMTGRRAATVLLEPGPVPTVPTAPAARAKRPRIWIAAAVALGLVVVMATVWLLTRPPRRSGRGPAAGSGHHRVFQVAETQALLAESGREVVVEGVLSKIYPTFTALYLEFGKDGTQPLVRGYIARKDAPEELSVAALNDLVGKRIRLTGALRLVPAGAANRPEVVLQNRVSIQKLP